MSAVGFALLAAVQPVGLIAYTLILTHGGRRTAWGFVAGWVLCAIVVALLTALLAYGAQQHSSSDTVSSAAWLQVVVGLAALVLLGVRLARRDHTGPKPTIEKPARPSREENVGPLGAAAIAALVQGWPIVAAAVAGVLTATDPGAGRVLGISLVVVLATSTYLAAQILSSLYPEQTDARLEAFRQLMAKDRETIINVALLVAGVWILGQGIVVQLST